MLWVQYAGMNDEFQGVSAEGDVAPQTYPHFSRSGS